MAYIDLQLTTQFELGSVIQLTNENDLNSWVLISSTPNSYLYGVVGNVIPHENEFMTRIHTAGEVRALSIRAIPDGGGPLGFENGGVYVDASQTIPRGIISFKSIGESSRNSNVLVNISLR
jgi:hypothetical protein